MDASTPGLLLSLPDELLELIFKSLRMRDLNSFCRTSWRCHGPMYTSRTGVRIKRLPIDIIAFGKGRRGYNARDGLQLLQVFHKHGASLEFDGVCPFVDKALRLGDGALLDFVLLHTSQPLRFVNAGDIQHPSTTTTLAVSHARSPTFLTSLLAHGMRLSDRTSTQQTILHRLIGSWTTEWIGIFLLEHPALDINAVDVDGNTALHLACRPHIDHQYRRWIPVLLKRGADMGIVNHTGQTPMDVAQGDLGEGTASNGWESGLAVKILTRFRCRRRREARKQWKSLSWHRIPRAEYEERDVWERMDGLA